MRVDTRILQRNVIILLAMEILYNLVMPVPNYDAQIQFSQNGNLTTYSLDDFLYVISLGKLYWIARVFKHASIFNNPTAYDIW